MLSIHRLIWDDWNIAHIARHGIIPEQVDEVCHGQPLAHSTYKNRIRLVGPTMKSRLLTIILAPTGKEGIYYPVTARPSDRKERKIYKEQIDQQP